MRMWGLARGALLASGVPSAAAGELQRPIEAGAPVAAFVSADAPQMDELERRGLVRSDGPSGGRRSQTLGLVALLTALSCAVLVAAGRLGARAT